jgi:hypothetical protein
MNVARMAGPALVGVPILLWGVVESLVAYGLIGLVAILVLRGVRVALPPAAHSCSPGSCRPCATPAAARPTSSPSRSSP